MMNKIITLLFVFLAVPVFSSCTALQRQEAGSSDGDGRDPNPDDPGSGGGVQPSSFHGTHVAGTIGAKSDNGDGVAGIDWNCKLMPLRALGKGGRGTLDDIANGILFAAGLQNSSGTVPAKRCDVLNMSLGGPGASQVMESACADANAAGVLLIAAGCALVGKSA